jgi:hypothetical protein
MLPTRHTHPCGPWPDLVVHDSDDVVQLGGHSVVHELKAPGAQWEVSKRHDRH